MYVDTRRGVTEVPTDASPQPSLSKVNKICDAVLSHLQSRKVIEHGTLQNIITANVCKDPPALVDGLLVVAKLMQEDERLAEKAVEHICFLADVNTLYDEALGLYNLDLALLVAQQSQRDPREYLPFIQDLHKLPDLRRRFAIDDHLNRREKALAHLHALQDHQEVRDYTVKHALYAAALKLYRYDEANLTALTRLYATYLETKSRFREAGLAHESLRDYAAAARCYQSAGASCWRECLFAAQQQSPAPSAAALADLATTFAEALCEARDYQAAATVQLDYLDAVEPAIATLCRGYHFGDALRVAALRRRPDLLESAVDPGLADALAASTELLAECKAQLRAQVPRIAELRRRAAEDPLGFYEGDRAGGESGTIPDDVSVAASSRASTGATGLYTRYTGSGVSAGTGASRATSKNRRREEKKRARGRKGTVYEEEYLVSSVRRLADRVAASAAPDAQRLAFALARRGMLERARALEALVADVVAACRAAVLDVFILPAAAADATVGHDAMAVGGAADDAAWTPTGADAVLHENMQGRWRTQEPPVVRDFERLSLLGS